MADLAVEVEAASDTPTGESEAAEEAGAEARESAGGIESREDEVFRMQVGLDAVVARMFGEYFILGPGEEGWGVGCAVGDGRWGRDGSQFSVLCSLFSVCRGPPTLP